MLSFLRDGSARLLGVLVILAASSLAAALSLPSSALGNSSEQMIKAIFQRNPADSDIVAEVDGLPVVRGAVRGATISIQEQQPGLPENEARKAAFRLVSRSVVAEAEAQRRGIRVSREEAQQFTDFQRDLYRRSSGNAKLAFSEAIANSGVSEDEFWRRQVDIYAKTLSIAKLRQQIIGEVADATPEAKERHYESFIDSLLSKARIDYRDPTLR